ncbi:MAG: SUMF1/EgtB/PvdO family nonheme iron enzyme, partial [Acidobacteriota bacterium]
ATVGAGSPTPLPTYWLSRFEVTNREYQEFVDAGGYESEELWPPMEEDGKRLDHTAAVDRFRDLTGSFGPSGWSFGSYPEGQADLPVRGLSWFEASAYARFAEASLPTVHHWRRAADPMVFGELLLESNFGDRVLAVGESGALGPFGTADMAGNVAEWCDTAIGDKRFVLGASWRDPSYVFANEPTLSPWQRLETVGFRLARYEQSLSQLAIDKAEVERYDFANVQIASDEVFQSLVSRYSYDAIDLDPQVLTREESSRHWRREVVALASPYSEERLQVALYIPKKARPPYQSVVWFPSSMAFFMPSIDEVPDLRLFQFVPKGGRVLALPAIARTHGRERVPLTGPNQHRDIFAQQVIDVRRTVDYLSTRADIDGESIALMGMSYGAEYAAVIAAVEKRLKTVILLAGGFDDLHMLREPYEIQPWHFAPRVLQPVLMLNGDADYSLPVSTAQKPLFDLLGTDPEHKKHVVLEGAHIPTDRHAIYRHSLDWFHRYLGAVAE